MEPSQTAYPLIGIICAIVIASAALITLCITGVKMMANSIRRSEKTDSRIEALAIQNTASGQRQEDALRNIENLYEHITDHAKQLADHKTEIGILKDRHIRPGGK